MGWYMGWMYIKAGKVLELWNHLPKIVNVLIYFSLNHFIESKKMPIASYRKIFKWVQKPKKVLQIAGGTVQQKSEF